MDHRRVTVRVLPPIATPRRRQRAHRLVGGAAEWGVAGPVGDVVRDAVRDERTQFGEVVHVLYRDGVLTPARLETADEVRASGPFSSRTRSARSTTASVDRTSGSAISSIAPSRT